METIIELQHVNLKFVECMNQDANDQGQRQMKVRLTTEAERQLGMGGLTAYVWTTQVWDEDFSVDLAVVKCKYGETYHNRHDGTETRSLKVISIQ